MGPWGYGIPIFLAIIVALVTATLEFGVHAAIIIGSVWAVCVFVILAAILVTRRSSDRRN
jgi:hypothetical protein